MKVEVELFATLAEYLPAGTSDRAPVDLPTDATVTDLLHTLGIPDAMPRIVLVNCHDAEDGERLRPGDVVSVFPPLAGGAHTSSK